MATAVKKCRVCGKEYKACRTLKRSAGIFRWQDVACSPGCGSVYLARIEASRGITHVETAVAIPDELVNETPALDISLAEDYDEDFEDEDFEDEDFEEIE